MVRERDIEAALVDAIKQLGGKAIKLLSPGSGGLPDRMILLPGGRLYFVELKAPGKKPSRLQLHVMEQLRQLGFSTHVIDSFAGVHQFVASITTVSTTDS